MSKSQWLKDEDQKGNFSNDKQHTFDPKKRYIGIRLQQGVPLLDRDWNELEDMRRHAEVTLRRCYIGNGTPDDGFRISLIDPETLDFRISAGRCLVDGFDVVNEPYDEGGNKLDFLLYSQQEGVPAITPLDKIRDDMVYLDVWVEEVSKDHDSALGNSQDIDMETCRRHKLEWRVRVDEGNHGYEKQPFHHYYDLAKIEWATAYTNLDFAVADLRCTGLSLDSLKKSFEADEWVTAARIAEKAVTRSKIRDGSVNEDKLSSSVRAKLVTNVDTHDHSGSDGAKINHSSLNKDDGSNPHGTTAGDVGALPITGGNIYGNFAITGSVGIGTTGPHPNLKLDVRGSNGWIGSGDNSQSIGGWRLGRSPIQPANEWVYLSRVDKDGVYQDLAVGALWAGGGLRFGSADDLAEMTPVDPEENLESGDVVVIDDSHCIRVTKSKKAYDKTVAGVISDPNTAGLVIGGSHPNDVKRPDIKAVALAGRVLTKVTLENGSIEAGDFLTTSSASGCAMKAKNNCFTLGKALEPFFGGTNGESNGKIWVLVNLGIYTENHANINSRIGVDFAEYFESKNGKKIKVGTAVVLEGDKVRPAVKNEIPMGIISNNPIIVGNIYAEWPIKYLKDEFAKIIMEEYKEEIMAPKKEKVKKERQKMEKKKVKEKVTRTEVVKIKGKYCQKEVTETIEREIEEPVFKEVNLYDARGKEVIGKHRIPVMETYEEEIDVLDKKGQPVMVGTGKFETKTRPKINPEYDEKKEYIPREKRPEWNCVGLLGQLPLRKGQPVADTWIKIKDISKDVELWLVK